jgi:2-methylisocitrate lyase-like PEP mutase family enzyme
MNTPTHTNWGDPARDNAERLAALAHQFRALHQRERGFVIPNPWDAGTARLLAQMGFEALASTSAGACWVLGVGDGQASREAVVSNAAAIAAATDLPTNADLLNGFADEPEAAAQTLVMAMEAGLAGGSLEDTTGRDDEPLYAFDLAVARVAAGVAAVRAAEARLGRPFTFTARCDGYLAGACDLKEAVRRIAAFADAGADVLYVPAVKNLAEVREVLAAAGGKPINVLGGPGELNDANALLDAGVQRISVGSGLYRAAAAGFLAAAAELKGGSLAWAAKAQPYKLLDQELSQ